jgi:glucosamine-phosphate N-acetyltransferase
MDAVTSLTPDNELELLFDPKLIPDDVKAQLPSHLHVRPLAFELAATMRL